MSLGPRISESITVKTWDDVKEYSPNTKCHICNGTNKVKVGKIPLMHCGLIKQVFGGHINWFLCQDCHEDGWQTPKEHYYGLHYFNSKTRKTKRHN